jgi:hypothetical protein
MKLRALQKYSLVIIAGTVFVIVLAGIIWLWTRASADKENVITQLADQQTQLEGLLALNPAPSQENIDALKREREQLAKLYAKLQEGTTQRPHFVVTNLVRDIQFKQLLGETVGRLEARARGIIKTPDIFRFGFSRYDSDFPCKQGNLSPDDCKKTLALLGKQLLTIEKLSGLLIDARIDELTAIRRTEVDPGGSADPDALDVPISTDPKGLYQVYPFELVFTCETKALRTFLDSLANAEVLFSVRNVKIDRALTTFTTGGSSGAAVRPGEAAPSTEPSKTFERARISATVRVDLIEFNEPAPPAKNPPAR